MNIVFDVNIFVRALAGRTTAPDLGEPLTGPEPYEYQLLWGVPRGFLRGYVIHGNQHIWSNIRRACINSLGFAPTEADNWVETCKRIVTFTGGSTDVAVTTTPAQVTSVIVRLGIEDWEDAQVFALAETVQTANPEFGKVRIVTEDRGFQVSTDQVEAIGCVSFGNFIQASRSLSAAA